MTPDAVLLAMGSGESALKALEDLASGQMPGGASTKTATSAPENTPPETGAARVMQIQWLGLDVITENRALSLLEAQLGRAYSREAESRDIAALLNSGLFTSASIRRADLSGNNVRLDIHVTERKKPLTPESRPLPIPAAEDLSDEATKALEALGAAEPDIPNPPWVLGEVSIEGLRNARDKVVRRQITAREGDLYDRGDLDNDYQNIMSLGKFDRVVTDITVLTDRRVPPYFEAASESDHPIRLTFIVSERPVIGNIRYEGRSKISKSRIRDELTLREKDPLNPNKLREDVEKVKELYAKKGFHRASIRTETSVSSDTWKADVVYVIEEGPKASIEEVRIHGAAAFKPKKVVKKMENRPKWFSADIFDESKMKTDLQAIEMFYKNRGYMDFNIASASHSFNDDLTKIFIDITIEEGKPYYFGQTTFSGNVIYASTALAKSVDYKPTKLFNQEKLDYTVQSFRELYAEQGRLRTEIFTQRTYNEETGLMDFHFDFTEGSTAYVDHTDVEGNKTTKPFVFKRELVIKPGMRFQVSKIRKSQERIRNLGFVDDVQLDVQSPFDPDLVDLTFSVIEGKPGMLTAGAGFSSLDGLIGTLSLQHLNMWGRAHRANASWSFGSRVNDFNLGYTLPWIYEKPISLGFDLFNTRRVSPFEGSNSAFTSKRLGGGVRVGPRFKDDKYRVGMNYTFQRITVTDIQEQFRDSLTDGTSTQSTVSLELARDTRDNIWDPARGSRNSIGFANAGGIFQGNIHFFKPFINNAWHKTLVEVNDYPLVLTFSNRASYITQYNATKQVPVFERFFIGGQDTLRGYSSTGEVGARDGGKVYDVFNIELGFPLARERRRTIVKFVTFFDMGGTWENMRSVRATIGKEARDLKTNVGFGIRFVTPAFPIRLDWGYGFQHRPGEEKSQINFGIGSLF